MKLWTKELKNQHRQEQKKGQTFLITKELFDFVKDGSKTLQPCLDFGNFKAIKTGDILEFKTPDNESVKVKVLEIRHYKTLESVLDREDVEKIFPGIEKSEAFLTMQEMFKQDQENIERHGLLIIEFQKI